MTHAKKIGIAIAATSLLWLAGCQPQRQQTIELGTVSLEPLETHYAPAENLEALDNHLLRSAKSTIDVCAFAFTDHELAEALESAAARGVHVRLYLDQGQTSGELARENRSSGDAPARKSSSRRSFDDESEGFADDAAAAGVLQQLAATANVEVRVKHSKTLMHLKSYVVDGAVLRSGSANFSPTGEKRQDNDLTLTRDRPSVERFRLNFNTLWTRPDNEPLAGAR